MPGRAEPNAALAVSAGDSYAAPSPGAAVVIRRFRKERAAVAGLVGLAIIALACFVAEPLLAKLVGHGADEPFLGAVDVHQRPVGPWTWVPENYPHHGRTLLLLGADGPLGRDELLRLLAGGQVSLEIAVIATTVALGIGVLCGLLAGYYGGPLDAAISRLTELAMSFPLLLLLIALGQTTAARFASITLAGLFQPGVLGLAVVIGLFSWFYPARVVRTLVLSLREQEFVEAARSIGARDRRVIFRHILPHIYGPLLVWGTLVASGVIILEASLSVLNFGIRLGTASWGNLLSQTWGTLLNAGPGTNDSGVAFPAPLLLKLLPSGALFLTVLCLALIGDGIRSALDPRSER